MTSRPAVILVHETMKLRPFWCTEKIPVGINVGISFLVKPFFHCKIFAQPLTKLLKTIYSVAHIPKNSLNSELTYLTIF